VLPLVEGQLAESKQTSKMSAKRPPPPGAQKPKTDDSQPLRLNTKRICLHLQGEVPLSPRVRASAAMQLRSSVFRVLHGVGW